MHATLVTILSALPMGEDEVLALEDSANKLGLGDVILERLILPLDAMLALDLWR